MKIFALKNIVALVACSLFLNACSPRDENVGTGALVGAGAGAGIGAAVGSASGHTGTGAAIGAAAGAITGAAIGETRAQSEASTKEKDDFMIRQRNEMKKQERELDDLRRQKLHDEYFRSQYQQ